ncbi:nucleotide-diphospho-sugar transferase [Blastocladiella britannica]|nr:nucleotide-diphospho-sugar transferase [Blastocladiella britannica]
MSATNSAPVLLSVVIPAYNEHERLPQMLDEAAAHLAHMAVPCEVIVVDDGSRDATAATALAWSRAHSNSGVSARFAVLRLPRNAGKGAAVRAGILRARGDLVLFADADGATRFADVDVLAASLLLLPTPISAATSTIEEDGESVWSKLARRVAAGNSKNDAIPDAIVVGSRAHLVTSEAVVKRSALRNLLMYAFHWVLYLLAGPLRAVGDTQCGFKLMTRRAAQRVVPGLHVSGWIFDIELLLRAVWLDIRVVEVMVTWQEIGGSKLNVASDSIQMLVDLLRLRVQYALGLWTVGEATV